MFRKSITAQLLLSFLEISAMDETQRSTAACTQASEIDTMQGSNDDVANPIGPHPMPFWKHSLRRLRMWFLLTFRYRLISVGREFYLGTGSIIYPNLLSVGDYCFMGSRCHIASKVSLGNWVMIASNVSMIGGDHRFRDVGTPMAWASRDVNAKIVIEDDVWVGHGATILHGVKIGEGSIVAAGALVTRDVPRYTIVGSRPSTAIGERLEGEALELHKKKLQKLRKDLGLANAAKHS